MLEDAFTNKLAENRLTEFFVLPHDPIWDDSLDTILFQPGDIVKFTPSSGTSRLYPLEILWLNRHCHGEWFKNMEEAEFEIGVNKGWLSKQIKRNHGKPFKMKVSQWIELEAYNESLSEIVQPNMTRTPSKRELDLGTDPKSGALLLFIEDWKSKRLLYHEYAVIEGKPVCGIIPFMILNISIWRCRIYK